MKSLGAGHWVRYLFFLALVSFLSLEFASRTFLRSRIVQSDGDERTLAYDYDPMLGWKPEENSYKEFQGTRKIKVQHNNRGFRDFEHLAEKKKPLRVLVFGDSFVWGYDVDQGERFTDWLNKTSPDMEVLNLGVSGYGTVQEYLLLRQEFDFYKPDIVLFMFSATDRTDNTSNFGYGAYYRPYYIRKNNELILKGVPVNIPMAYRIRDHFLFRHFYSIRLIGQVFNRIFYPVIEVEDLSFELLRAARDFTTAGGAKFGVLFADDDFVLQHLCRQNNISFFSLSEVGEPFRYPSAGRHWTPEGHFVVARILHDFLKINLAGGSLSESQPIPQNP